MSEGEQYDGPGDPADLPLYRKTDLFYLLSQHRKRAVVLTLALAPWSRVHLQQLAEVIAILEADAERTTLSTAHVRTVRTNLKRSHLGPLEQAGVIASADDQSDVFVPGPAFAGAVYTLTTAGSSLADTPRRK
ncbi:hypothetical protein [Halorubrum sp. CSM-61]|uniref:DUF7344 domain-containing protein n=1 Tax=Halorubrum sp. CSM-61 TaxID=2485838 RepID=UPI000F4C8DAC|nr:hypothetical protein [Halorubrum sp. CSM-61]